jgi:hypothetical protein
VPAANAGDDNEERHPGSLSRSAARPIDVPPLLVDPAPEVLPFDQLTPQRFEKLVLRLIELDPTMGRCRQWGESGQAQDGIDLYAPLRSPNRAGRLYLTVQCRNTVTMDGADIADVVKKFRCGRWADQSDEFVLATRASVRRTGPLKAVEAARETLDDTGVRFDLWDGEALSRRLRTLPAVVEEFFGVEAAYRYCLRANRPKTPRSRWWWVAAAVQVVALTVAATGFVLTRPTNRASPPPEKPHVKPPRVVQIEPSESGGYLQLSTVVDNPSAVTETVTGLSLTLTTRGWNTWLSPLSHDSYRVMPVALAKRQGSDGFTFSGGVAHLGALDATAPGFGQPRPPAQSSAAPILELRGQVNAKPGQVPTLRLEFDPTTVLQPSSVTALVLELPSRMVLREDPDMSAPTSHAMSAFDRAPPLPSMSQIVRIEVATRTVGIWSGATGLCVSRAPSPSTGVWGAC